MKPVKPLTAAETKWLDKLQALLDKCPSERLGAFTIGDPSLSIYDKTYFDDFRNSQEYSRDEPDDVYVHEKLGTVLYYLDMPFQVDGVCG
jgi:hypothetical protein